MKTGTDITIERVMARRKAAGLLVSTDRESAALTEQIGRFTYFAKDIADRDAFIARAERNGLNPRVEAA